MKARELDNWMAILERFGILRTVDRWHTVEVRGKYRKEHVIEMTDGCLLLRIRIRGGNVLKPVVEE